MQTSPSKQAQWEYILLFSLGHDTHKPLKVHLSLPDRLWAVVWLLIHVKANSFCLLAEQGRCLCAHTWLGARTDEMQAHILPVCCLCSEPGSWTWIFLVWSHHPASRGYFTECHSIMDWKASVCSPLPCRLVQSKQGLWLTIILQKCHFPAYLLLGQNYRHWVQQA